MEPEQERLIEREDVVTIMFLLSDMLTELKGIRQDLRDDGEEEEEGF
jgi:hypothetical protein